MSTPQKCEDLEVGDITIALLNSDNPDAISMFVLTDIDPTVGSIYVTDNAWTGSALATTEGTLKLDIPAGGLDMGTLIGYGTVASPPTEFKSDWTTDGFFDIGINGDQLLIYCLKDDGAANFLWGFNTLADWAPSDLADYGTNTSALPQGLVNGNVAFEDCDNLFWKDPTPGISTSDKSEILAKFLDVENYDCNDDTRWEYDGTSPGNAGAHVDPQACIFFTLCGLFWTWWRS
jgi:hypothetical protein